MFIEEKLNYVRYCVDREAHIVVNRTLCRDCPHRACTRCCPAECYKLENGQLQFTYEGCLECGTCRFVCDRGAVDWDYPRGGFGVCYRFG